MFSTCFYPEPLYLKNPRQKNEYMFQHEIWFLVMTPVACQFFFFILCEGVLAYRMCS